MLLYQWRNHFVYYIQRQLVNKKNKIKNTVGFKDENNGNGWWDLSVLT